MYQRPVYFEQTKARRIKGDVGEIRVQIQHLLKKNRVWIEKDEALERECRLLTEMIEKRGVGFASEENLIPEGFLIEED